MLRLLRTSLLARFKEIVPHDWMLLGFLKHEAGWGSDMHWIVNEPEYISTISEACAMRRPEHDQL